MVTWKTAGASSPQFEGWAYNIGSPGVVIYSIIHKVTNGVDQSATVLANYGVFNSVPALPGIGSVIPFDNQTQAATLTLCDPGLDSHAADTDSINVNVLDSNGNLIGQHTLSMGGDTQMSFALATQFPEAANITGTLVFSASSLVSQTPITPILTETSTGGFTVTPLFEPFDLTGKVPGMPTAPVFNWPRTPRSYR
jgi:hypothetical protein